MESFNISVIAGPASIAVNGTQPVFNRERIRNVSLGELSAAFRSTCIGRDFKCYIAVPSSGYELKIGLAESSFQRCQLLANGTSRSGFRS